MLQIPPCRDVACNVSTGGLGAIICIIYNGISYKKPSRTKTAIHDRPERMLKISSPDYLEFNRLI
jgi:hypothetical protein